jgi:flagellar biosynthetic protein FlhB
LANEDRTEQPTQRRKEEARKKGQVVRSTEVNSALILLCTFLFLKFFAAWMGVRSVAFTKQYFDLMGQTWNSGTLNQINYLSAIYFAELCLPVMGVALAAGLVANFVQVGVLFTPDNLMPKWERINPAEGFKRIFSRRSLAELGKSVAKIGISGYLAYGVIIANLDTFPRLMDMSLTDAITTVANLASTIIMRIGIFLLVLAVADYLFQYSEHQKSIRMTKQEVKEEFHQYEGDPLIKSQRRRRQRAMSMQRMMQAVPKADVVITNPTHYAVALQYDPSKQAAPVMLAKGVDEIALRIKKVAEENDVVIFEDPPLARTIYGTVEIGQRIPENLYETVANVLSFVYRLRPNYFKSKGKR